MSWWQARLSSVCAGLFGDRWWIFTFCFPREKSSATQRRRNNSDGDVLFHDDELRLDDVTINDVTDTDSGLATSVQGLDNMSSAGSLSPDTKPLDEVVCFQVSPSNKNVFLVTNHSGFRTSYDEVTCNDVIRTRYENGVCHGNHTLLPDGVHTLLSHVYHVTPKDQRRDDDIRIDADDNCNSICIQREGINVEPFNGAHKVDTSSALSYMKCVAVVNLDRCDTIVIEPPSEIDQCSRDQQLPVIDDVIMNEIEELAVHTNKLEKNNSPTTVLGDSFDHINALRSSRVDVEALKNIANNLSSQENVVSINHPCISVQETAFITNDTPEPSRFYGMEKEQIVAVVHETLFSSDLMQTSETDSTQCATDVTTQSCDTVGFESDEDVTNASDVMEFSDVTSLVNFGAPSFHDHTYSVDHVTDIKLKNNNETLCEPPDLVSTRPVVVETNGNYEMDIVIPNTRQIEGVTDVTQLKGNIGIELEHDDIERSHQIEHPEQVADVIKFKGNVKLKLGDFENKHKIEQLKLVVDDHEDELNGNTVFGDIKQSRLTINYLKGEGDVMSNIPATSDSSTENDVLNSINNCNLVSNEVLTAWERSIIEDKEIDFPPPASPTNANFLDSLSDISFDTEEWFEDFDATTATRTVTSIEHENVTAGTATTVFDSDVTKSPPPYAAITDTPLCNSMSAGSSLPLDLPPFSAIPSTVDDVTILINSALDVCWQCRRYGEPLDAILPPQSYFSQEDSSDSLVSTSSRTFKRLVFDLVAEVLRSIYHEEENQEQTPWSGISLVRTQRFPIDNNRIPTTIDAVRPVVYDHVMRCLGKTSEERTISKSNKWLLGRKANTVVDHMLVEELCLEEPEWVHYDRDITTRKLQIADFLMEALIYDTTEAVSNIERIRVTRQGMTSPR